TLSFDGAGTSDCVVPSALAFTGFCTTFTLVTSFFVLAPSFFKGILPFFFGGSQIGSSSLCARVTHLLSTTSLA
ncbi:hypothetical protein GOP47_0013908, partial [Adiantum capillus-veneris]